MVTEEEYTECYNKYHHKLISVLISRGSDPYDARYIAQTAWGLAWLKREQYSGKMGAQLHTWVTRIAINQLYSQYRYNRKFASLSEVDRLLNCKIVDQVDDRELHRLLVVQSEFLSPMYRKCIEMLLSGMSNEEMAATMGVCINTLKPRVHRAIKHLTRLMKPYVHGRL